MKNFWLNLSIKTKIAYSVLVGVMIAGALCFFTFKILFYNDQVEQLVNDARMIGSQIEYSIHYSSDKAKNPDLQSDSSIQRQKSNSIVSALEITKRSVKDYSVNLYIPNSGAAEYSRPITNNIDSELQKELNSGKINECNFIDDETEKMVYIKVISLPRQAVEEINYQNNSSFVNTAGGEDTKGYLEIASPLANAKTATLNNSLITGGVTFFAAGLVVIFMFSLAKQIDRRLLKLQQIAKELKSGNYDYNVPIIGHDEICDLASEFNHMASKIKDVNRHMLEEKSMVDNKIADAINESEDERRYLKNQTEVMLEAMNKFADGDLTISLNIEKNDEIGKLFEGFNKAVSNMGNLLSQVTEAVQATASASNEISSSSEEMAAGAQEQSSQTTEVAGAVEQMTKTIMETTKNASTASEAAKNSGIIAKEGGRVVTETIEGMNRVAQVVKQSAEMVHTLGKNSDQIGEIVQVIDDIADQTNLLALNAAIEAARAGEQGRGFAVVADEVRKLAERTTKATKEIASMIKQIQKDTEGAVQSMNQGTNEVARGKELANKAGDSLREIIAGADEVVDMVTQVAAANEEQSSAAEQISKNIEGISNVTQESAAGVQQIARAAEDLNRLTINLQELVSRFKIGVKRENYSKQSDTSKNKSQLAVRSNGKLIHH